MYATFEPALIPEPAPQRWLLPALLVSVLLHLIVLSCDYGRPVAPTTPRINVTLKDSLIPAAASEPESPSIESSPPQPAPAATTRSEPAIQEVEQVATETVTTSGGLPVDWKAAVRNAIRSQEPQRNIYEPPPLEHYRLDHAAEGSRIPELARAFTPLERATELCPAEAVFNLQDRQVVLPVTRACTETDEKARQDDIIRRRLEARDD